MSTAVLEGNLGRSSKIESNPISRQGNLISRNFSYSVRGCRETHEMTAGFTSVLVPTAKNADQPGAG